MSCTKRIIFSFILILALSSCAVTNNPAAIDPKSNLVELASKEGFEKAFRHWMSEIAAMERFSYKEFGLNYYVDIPYYEIERWGSSYPYLYESDSLDRTMESLCSASGFTYGSAKEVSSNEFIIVDPARTRNPQPWYWSCNDGKKVQYVWKQTNYKNNKIRINLIRASDIEKSIALKRKKRIALSERKKEISMAFKERLKPGDRTTLGMVIEVKPPIALVQTRNGQEWIDIILLEPVGLW